MMRALAITAALLASCGPSERTLELVLVTNDDGEYRGTRCLSDDAQLDPLVYRGIIRGEQRAEYNVVVDVVDLGGTPSCRNSILQEWCEEHECFPLLRDRTCHPVNVPFEAGVTLQQSLVEAVEKLEGTLLIEDAPDSGVVVRVVFTVQPCEELMTSAAFADDSLVGCLFSCPALLDNLSQSLSLDLDLSNIDCLSGVRWCSAEDFRAPITEQ
jgi:hypothetical protein